MVFSEDRWVTVEAVRALYVDDGINTILCDRLPSDVKLVLRMTPQQISAASNALSKSAFCKREIATGAGQ